ncbi:hypothetical protein [Streptomyces sp. NPDC004270]
MSSEAVFVAGYVPALLVVMGLLELYGRHSTGAWASRAFTGYRRAVPGAPEPADPTDWGAAEAELTITGESK